MKSKKTEILTAYSSKEFKKQVVKLARSRELTVSSLIVESLKREVALNE